MKAIAPDWASLPADLINSIADSVLSTDDLDYYMDLRAVCRTWRASTADPKTSPCDPRFHPRRWAMLDKAGVVHQSDDARLFVNLTTGRFVRKDMPMLGSYFLVAGAAGGLLVLADRSAPHAPRVLNPFTGGLICFAAPVPLETAVVAHVVGSSPPTLVLRCYESRTIYWADPDDESFHVRKEKHGSHPWVWILSLLCAIYAAARDHLGPFASLLDASANSILGLVTEEQAATRGYLVESEGGTLVVFKKQHRMEVFKLNMVDANLLEPVKDIGSRALFLGGCRGLSVGAAKFASVDANCVYYVVKDGPCDICVYSLKDENEVRIGGVMDPLSPVELVKLLCSHAFMVSESQLTWEKLRVRKLHPNWILEDLWFLQ